VGAQPFTYAVQRDAWGAGRTDVLLVRRSETRGFSLRHRADDAPAVLFRRTFRPLLELRELERYAAELERVARHANDGTLGCFVDTRSHDGAVEVALYDRWFDGEHLRCDELARRHYDAGDDQALVASAEFVAELEDWAQRRNDERAEAEAGARAEAEVAQQLARDRTTAADELAGILRAHAVPDT
jgi:hypothetical protein